MQEKYLNVLFTCNVTECLSTCAFNQVTKFFFWGVMRKKGDFCLTSLLGINRRIHIKIKGRRSGGILTIHVPYILLPSLNNDFLVQKTSCITCVFHGHYVSRANPLQQCQLHLNNRPQVSMGYKLINHRGMLVDHEKNL